MFPRSTFGKKDALVSILCVLVLGAGLRAFSMGGRRHAKAIVCQAHLAQWNHIFQNYLAENDGEFFTGQSGLGYWWPQQLDDDLKDWKRNKIWFCPEAETPMSDEHGNHVSDFGIFTAWGIYHAGDRTGENGITGSYGVNGYVIRASGSTYEGGVPTRHGWKSFDVPEADRIPLFLDALRFDLWPSETEGPAQSEVSAWSGNNMGRCAINRHMGSINSLFLDGSARRVDLKELWTLKWHREFDTAGPWTLAGGVQPDDWPEWIREFPDY